MIRAKNITITQLPLEPQRQPQRQRPTQTFSVSVSSIMAEVNKYTYPDIQRAFTWAESWKAVLIQTILEGGTIPPLFLNKVIHEDGSVEWEVIDGQQRLKSIITFIRGMYRTALPNEAKRNDVGGEYPIEPGRHFHELTVKAQQTIMNYELTIQSTEGLSRHDIGVHYRRCNHNSLHLTLAEKLLSYDGKIIDYARNISKHPFWSENYTGGKVKCEDIQGSLFPIILEIDQSEYVRLASATVKSYAFGTCDNATIPPILTAVEERLHLLQHLFAGATFTQNIQIIPMYQAVRILTQEGIDGGMCEKGILTPWFQKIQERNRGWGYGDEFRLMVNIKSQKAFWLVQRPRILGMCTKQNLMAAIS